MSLVQNVPCFSVLLPMFAAIVTSAVGGKKARTISLAVTAVTLIMSFALLLFTMETGESFVYVMGHFPAPWGNELRAGCLEAGIAVLFSFITLFSLTGGYVMLRVALEEEKTNFYYIMVDLMLASNLALVYTNDMFTAYVFVEISTIAACGLIVSRKDNYSVVAGIRYMVMSLMGSGLLLLGICFMYDVTGQLLMEPAGKAYSALFYEGAYAVPVITTIALISVGLAIKSALWPFHAWLPDAYGNSTAASSAILSSIVSKGYIILLIKIIARVFGFLDFNASRVTIILFCFGIAGMILGSIQAIRQTNLRRMIAFSSVAQIGYIFMGIGMATTRAMEGSLYHVFAHASAKSLAFIAAVGLIRAAAGSEDIRDMYGAGFRNKIAGLGFSVASLSMIGVPGFAGFVSKFMLAEASFNRITIAVPVLIALAISTLLNTIYFMRVVLVIYTPLSEAEKRMGATLEKVSNDRQYVFAILAAIAFNLALGIFTEPFSHIVRAGFHMLG